MVTMASRSELSNQISEVKLKGSHGHTDFWDPVARNTWPCLKFWQPTPSHPGSRASLLYPQLNDLVSPRSQGSWTQRQETQWRGRCWGNCIASSSPWWPAGHLSVHRASLQRKGARPPGSGESAWDPSSALGQCLWQSPEARWASSSLPCKRRGGNCSRNSHRPPSRRKWDAQ